MSSDRDGNGIREVSVQALFKDSRFLVPLYQRTYSWGGGKDRNIPTLWNDIISTRDANRDASKNESGAEHLYQHFMSSILIRNDTESWNRRYSIVDGQQRIVTITLCLLAGLSILETGLKEEKVDNRYSFMSESSIIEKRYSDLRGTLKALLFKEDLLDMDDYIWTTGIDKAVQRQDVVVFENEEAGEAFSTLMHDYTKKDFSDTVRNSKIFKAFEFFKNNLNEQADIDNNIYKLKCSNEKSNQESNVLPTSDNFFYTIFTVLRSLKLIVIPIGSKEEPQRIFESVNGLTKELTVGELVKNYLLMNLSSEDRIKEVYKKYWSSYDTEKWTNNDNKKMFFRDAIYHYLKAKTTSSNHPRKDSTDIYNAFREYVNLTFETNKSIKEEKVIRISSEIKLCVDSLEELERLSKTSSVGDRLLTYFRIVHEGFSVKHYELLFKLLLTIKEVEDKYQLNKLSEKQLDMMFAPIESYVARRFFGKNFGGGNTDYLVSSLVKANEYLLSYADSADHYFSNYERILTGYILENDSKSLKWLSNQEVAENVCGIPGKQHPKFLKEYDMVKNLLRAIEHHYDENNEFYAIKSARFSSTKDFTLEHWMPQNGTNWTISEPVNYTTLVNALGNMALIPGPLNGKLGNRSLEGKISIVDNLLQGRHQTGIWTFDMLLELTKEGGISWDEDKIYKRAKMIVDYAFTNIFKEASEFTSKKGKKLNAADPGSVSSPEVWDPKNGYLRIGLVYEGRGVRAVAKKGKNGISLISVSNLPSGVPDFLSEEIRENSLFLQRTSITDDKGQINWEGNSEYKAPEVWLSAICAAPMSNEWVPEYSEPLPPLTDRWEDRIEWLKIFVRKYGREPYEGTSGSDENKMGYWCRSIRSGKLSIDDEQWKAFSSIEGVRTDPIRNNRVIPWEDNLQALSELVKRKGKLPGTTEGTREERRLAKWADNRKQEYKRGTLSVSRAQAITDVIPDWDWGA